MFKESDVREILEEKEQLRLQNLLNVRGEAVIETLENVTENLVQEYASSQTLKGK